MKVVASRHRVAKSRKPAKIEKDDRNVDARRDLLAILGIRRKR